MTFEEVLQALKDEKSIKRLSSGYPIFICLNRSNKLNIRAGSQKGISWSYRISVDDLLAYDWEVIEE